MSAEKTEVETFFGRCRCCLTYGYLKNMWVEHKFEGEAEVYGEMLVQCFAMVLDHSDDTMDQDQICEMCISRLREANDFKKVVLDSQEELLQEAEAEKNLEIKEERLEEDLLDRLDSDGDTTSTSFPILEDTADSTTYIKDEMEYEEIEYLEEDDAAGVATVALDIDQSQLSNESNPVKRRKKQPRQTEPQEEEGPKRKWPKKLPKSERLKTYKQYTEADLRKCLEEVRNNTLTPSEASLIYDVPKKTICAKIQMDPAGTNDGQKDKNEMDAKSNKTRPSKLQQNDAHRSEITVDSDDEKDISKTKKNKYLLAKFKITVRSILSCTNATPIRGHWGIGYACIYCKYQTPKPTELKSHTLTTHSENVDELDSLKYAADMIAKLDITDLKCTICDQSSETLEEIMHHINYIHKQPIHFSITNHIVPFIFRDENVTCALCDKQFNYFKQLYEHMNEHFPNFKCSKCERVFINQRSQRTHMTRHKIGTFICAFCSKIFNTRIKMKEHERVLHLKGSKTRKCGYCDEKFMDVVKRTDHEVKEHGAPVPKYECKACGKFYDSRRSLTNHVNHYHLLQRPNKCPECGKGFYNKNELKRHWVKHTKIKEFQCSICSKFYCTKSSLKTHIKMHDSDKCFTCERCGETFIQKNVWVNHMSNHADVDRKESAEIA